MERIQSFIQRIFVPARPLPPGIYHYQAPPDTTTPLRLHLRLEPNGEGVLIVNASTVLHLNQTAAEMAYHLIQQTAEHDVGRQISERYRIKIEEAQRDFAEFKERLATLINAPDLDPVGYLGFEQAPMHSGKVSAPYRIDCALTYRLPGMGYEANVPLKRVSRELDEAEWQLILQKAWQAGIPHATFTGGEATLRPDLPYLIEFAEKLGMVTGLLTDGLLLAEPGYLQKILNAGLDHLMIVLDYKNELAWKGVRDSLAEDIAVEVHLTMTRANAAELPSQVDRLAQMGLKLISLSADDPSLNESLQALRREVAEKGLELVWDLPVPYSALNPVALELPDEEEIQGAGKAWIYVEPDGDVLPGQGILEDLGNLLTDSWETVWAKRRQ